MFGEPAPVDPRSAGPDFWTRFHRLRRARQAEERPDEPPEPDADVEREMKRDDPFDFRHYYEVSRDGEMAGWFHGETVKPENPEHATNKHLFWADGYVMEEHRRRGIAASLVPVVADLMDGHGCSVLGLQSAQPSGRAFALWLGAAPKLVNVVSRLDLAAVDWTMLERWAEDGTRRSPQTRLEIHPGGVPESMWDDFAPQFTAMFNTMPLEELDLGDMIFTPERLRVWAERRRLSGQVLHSVLTREPDGVISGVTETLWAPYRPALVYQEFTGVRPDQQGRGLGKWIKAAMLLHLRQVYPDLRWVVTDNAQSNAAMLGINRAMGFQGFREEVDYQVSRAGLERRLRAL